MTIPYEVAVKNNRTLVTSTESRDTLAEEVCVILTLSENMTITVRNSGNERFCYLLQKLFESMFIFLRTAIGKISE